MADGDFTVAVKSHRMGGTEPVRVCGIGRALLARGCWWVGKNGYVCGRLAGRLTTLHREVMQEWVAPGQHVDHLNGDPLDCRRCNLEAVSVSENMARRTMPVGQSGVRGVTQTKDGRWRARATINGRRVTLGEFRSLERAAKAVRDAGG